MQNCGKPKYLSYMTFFGVFDYNVHGKYVNNYKRIGIIKNNSKCLKKTITVKYFFLGIYYSFVG